MCYCCSRACTCICGPCRAAAMTRIDIHSSRALALTVLRASGQTASSHLTRIKITHHTCTGGNVHVACRDRGLDGPFLFHRQDVAKMRFPPV